MKKHLAALTGIALLLPSLASAAYDDVTLTTSAVFTVNGIEIDVHGSSATLESISVTDSNTLSIGLQHDSGITIKAPNRNQMSIPSVNGAEITRTCNDSESSAVISGIVGTTVTVTPSTSLCTAASGNGAPSGGGGGGGGPIAASPAQTTPQPAAPAATLPTAPAQVASNAVFTRDLKLGSQGVDVKALQIYLNTHGYVIAKAGPGSPGMETTTFGGATKAALVKLQKAAGITPAAGYFGKKTRDYISAFGEAASDSLPAAPAQSISAEAPMIDASAFVRNLQTGSQGADVKALQIYLNTHGYVIAKAGPGSPGMETTKFGAATRAALIQLQKAAGIKPASGYFGPATRAYIQSHQ